MSQLGHSLPISFGVREPAPNFKLESRDPRLMRHQSNGDAELPTRRFAPPWSVDGLEACFVVKDGSGQKLAYVHYEEEPGRRSAAKLLTKDEA
jgi:hypothetical protein